jgi:hypothetical protein
MSRSTELDLLLRELNALWRRARELLEPGMDGGTVDEYALAEVDLLIDQIGEKTRQLRLLAFELPAAEWQSIVAECRRECQTSIAQFIDWLGPPQLEE